VYLFHLIFSACPERQSSLRIYKKSLSPIAVMAGIVYADLRGI